MYICAIREMDVYLYIGMRGNFEKNFLFTLTRSGYVESAASGLYAGLAAAFQAEGRQMPALSGKTAMGALARYISSSPSADFQPMNITFGIIDPPEQRFRKKAEKNTYLSQRALEEVREWVGRLAN